MISGKITYEFTNRKEKSLSTELDLNVGILNQLFSQTQHNYGNNYTQKITSNTFEHAFNLKVHRALSRTLSQKGKRLRSYIDFKLSILDRQFAQIETMLLGKTVKKRKDVLDVYSRTVLSIQKMVTQFSECCLQNERKRECLIVEKNIMRRLRNFSLRIGYESRGDIKLLSIPVDSQEFYRHEQAINNYFVETKENQFLTRGKKLKVIAVFKIKNCAIQTMFRQSLENSEQNIKQEIRGLYREVPLNNFEQTILFAGRTRNERMVGKDKALHEYLFQNERNKFLQTSFGSMNKKDQSPVGLSFSKRSEVGLEDCFKTEENANDTNIVMLSLCQVLLKPRYSYSSKFSFDSSLCNMIIF